MIKITGIDSVIKRLEDIDFKSKQKILMTRLAEIGVDTASVLFQQAQYDGVNDVIVNEPRWAGGNKLIIEATGQSVAFIEFGTGIIYADDHPKAAEFGAIRGSYGQGKGNRSSWGYYGEPGTNGEVKVNKSGKTVVITQGNPAARAMYEAGKGMRNRILEIAKEVYKK